MSKSLNIINSSLRLTLQELKVNKLRTALSLFGVAFGILCIIGVLSFVDSISRNIQNQIGSLGNNTIYIDKWEYGGGPDKPWWKFVSRPTMKIEEMNLLKQRSFLTEDLSFLLDASGTISVDNTVIQNISVFGISAAQINTQPFGFAEGRYFSDAEFNDGANVCLIGFTNAESLFGNAQKAVGKQIELKEKKITIVGVIKKMGKPIFMDYDNCVMLPYEFSKAIYDIRTHHTLIIVKGKDKIKPIDLSNELEGIMRQIRRLPPTQENNFSLNSVEGLSKAVSGFFSLFNIIGSFIGGISLIIGLFGISNIMFVTVKERTPIIGLKKAIGAKNGSILFEFLMEAVILCLMGGAIGLLMVFILAKIATNNFDFPVFISLPMLITTIIICLIVGVLAGIIPARRASKMDAVVAIRS